MSKNSFEKKDYFATLTFDEKSSIRNVYEQIDSDGNNELSKTGKYI
jgi:hypothetical protein